MLAQDRQVPASIARALVNHYRSDLASAAAQEPPRFSVVRLLRSVVDRTPLSGYDSEIVCAASQLAGERYPDPFRSWVPFAALRSMTTSSGPSGGYAVGVDVGSPAFLLSPWSVAAASGAVILPGLKSPFTVPAVSANPVVTWLAEGGPGPTDTEPTLGQVSMTPRTAIGVLRVSIQLLKQGEGAEPMIRKLLLAAVGQAIDRAFFAGAGGAEPLGLFNTAGHNAVSGTSLDLADLLSMRRKVLDAGGKEEMLQWVGSPAVQETLGARARSTGGDRLLWDDDGVLGRPAFATATAPATGLVCGDFSAATIGLWGAGVRIDVNPSQDFDQAGVAFRVLVDIDVGFPQPAAFSVAAVVT